MSEENGKKLKRRNKTVRVLTAVLWAAVITLLVLNKDKISIDGVVGLTPAGMVPAVLLLLLLFALKSVTVVVYSGILYAASGIVFPLYLALAVSFAGTVVMLTIPYFIGKRLGTVGLYKLYQKHPKLNRLHVYRSQNDFLFAFLTRIIGLPNDPVSACMGAAGVKYGEYLLGSLLGLAPGTVIFTVMGTCANDVTSPAFLILLGTEIVLTMAAITFVKIKKNKNFYTARRDKNGK